jgi:capsular polysaccharide biosynthesis protein
VDFWDLTKLLVRRWYVAVPLLLLTAVGAVGLAASIKPDYIADSYITMVPPNATSTNPDTTSRNPWLQTGLTTLGSAAIYSTQDASVVERMVREGYSDNFTLAFDGDSPIIKIEVTATSKVQAKSTAEEVANLFAQSVKQLQQSYNPRDDEYITTHRLDQGDNIKSSTTKLKRAVIAIVGAGLLISIAMTAIVDTILQRRARRKATGRPAEAEPLPRKGPPERGTNGSATDLGTLRDRETELIPPSGGGERVRSGGGRDKRGPGEYRSGAREQADETTILRATASDDTAVASPPMPSDATMILPLPAEKEPWAARDGRGNNNNRGGSSRR